MAVNSTMPLSWVKLLKMERGLSACTIASRTGRNVSGMVPSGLARAASTRWVAWQRKQMGWPSARVRRPNAVSPQTAQVISGAW
jgi:hypothetical protein